MKNTSVKSISIFVKGKDKAKWIFDVSDKTAEKIIADFNSDSKTFAIENIPSANGTFTIYINKDRIDYVTVE